MNNLKNDLRYLHTFFKWSDDEKREIWEVSKANDEMKSYWSRMADAYRRGYRQTAENGFLRLRQWEEQNEK